MTKFTLKSLLIIVLAIMPMTFFGQNNDTQTKPNNNHYWYVGFDEGGTLLFGDNKSWDFPNIRPEIGIHGGYTFAKHFSVYARLSAGTLRGKLDNTFVIENASFIGADLNLTADVVSLIAGYNPDRVFGLKPHIGFGQIQYQTRTIVNGVTNKYGYNDETTTVKGNGIGGRKVVFDVPMGVELEFNINRRIALFTDITANYTDTECLDGYPSGDHKDWFSTGTVGFRYKFRKDDPVEKEPCPETQPNCESCKEAIQQAVKEAVEEALKDYQPAPAAEEAEAEEEQPEEANELKNFEERDIHLTFKVGKAEVENTQANKDEVKKVSEDMDNGREIHTIKTIGHASPEGNDEQNQKLSEDRAQATADFIQKQLGDNAEGITFEAKGEGSDWDGFYAALESSNIENKAEIAETIKNSDNPTVTLNQMRNQYPELNDILNGLRVTRVYINK